MPGLVAEGRAEAWDDAGGGDAITVAGGGPVVGAFILDFFAAHPVPGAEPAWAAMEGALFRHQRRVERGRVGGDHGRAFRPGHPEKDARQK